jgi:hypothetical protein
MLRPIAGILLATFLSGCELFPQAIHRPVILNPFPELSRIAVAPFVNLSDEPTVDGHTLAKAYFAELQATPGFEVVPLAVTETAMRQHRLDLNQPAEARRLAQILGVDAVVVGAVTDYSPYYPPRLGLHVQWWAADPRILAIPPGYGLPWGTPEEEFIPDRLAYEAEMASLRAELELRAIPQDPAAEEVVPPAGLPPNDLPPPLDENRTDGDPPAAGQAARITGGALAGASSADAMALSPEDRVPGVGSACPRGGPPWIPVGRGPSEGPVLSHTRIFQGHDSDVAEALTTYSNFRTDARFGGWQAYLQRSDDFIRFCCHLHISEMLSARGGAGKTRVVWQWSHSR